METVPIHAIAQVIRLAVAPVFLLTGIAGILNVLSQRLSRAVDRTRLVDRFLHGMESDVHRAQLQKEIKTLETLETLETRTQIIHWAMRLAVGSALAICVVVVCLFVGDVASVKMGAVISGLFIAAMVLVILSLVLFIVETTVHTQNLQHDIEHLLAGPQARRETD